MAVGMVAINRLRQRAPGLEAGLRFGRLQALQGVGLRQLDLAVRERGRACHFGQKLHHARGIRGQRVAVHRSEEHTSELQSLMRISYAVFCLKKKKKKQYNKRSDIKY